MIPYASLRLLAAHLFGKPDGLLPSLLCRWFGHDWWACDDDCCQGVKWWCVRCLAPRPW